jgi:hypothetical protein
MSLIWQCGYFLDYLSFDNISTCDVGLYLSLQSMCYPVHLQQDLTMMLCRVSMYSSEQIRSDHQLLRSEAVQPKGTIWPVSVTIPSSPLLDHKFKLQESNRRVPDFEGVVIWQSSRSFPYKPAKPLWLFTQ